MHLKAPSEGGSQIWQCQECLVLLLGQRESSRAQAMDTALLAGLQGNEMFVCFCFSSEVHNSLKSLQGVLLFTDSESGKNHLAFFFLIAWIK